MTTPLTNEEQSKLRVFCESCHVCGGITCATVDAGQVNEAELGKEFIECLRRGDFVSMESLKVARENFGCKCDKTALEVSK